MARRKDQQPEQQNPQIQPDAPVAGRNADGTLGDGPNTAPEGQDPAAQGSEPSPGEPAGDRRPL